MCIRDRSNLIEGAVLAIIVLALFLKDLRPTIVVAISMPLSVLFAICLLYTSPCHSPKYFGQPHSSLPHRLRAEPPHRGGQGVSTPFSTA